MSALMSINPGFILIIAGLVVAVLPIKRARQAIAIIAPMIAMGLLLEAKWNVVHASASFLGVDLILYQVDNFNYIFGIAFLIAALLNAIYALHQDSVVEDSSALIYGGAAIAAVFAGDLITLFVFWELTAVSSVFLILKTGTRAAYGAAMRYLAVQVLSGVLLLYGAILLLNATGDISVRNLALGTSPGAWYIFIAFGLKAAFPLLHNWLQDSYPKATIVGAVVLSAFTTKLAVYALIRVFPGEPSLIWIGAIMTLFPVFFAVIENDLRRVLSYSINNQVGFMVVGVGIGGALGINGAAAHAFADVIFKGLLFMSMGAVLYRTGTIKASELGGLYKSMPWTTLFCLIGAASISALPFFSAFVTKSMIISAVAEQNMIWIWLALLFASAGVLEHAGIKIPYFAFFAHDSGKRVKEAPFNMLFAMGLAAFLCIAIGMPAIAPGLGYEWLYQKLPYPDVARAYHPYELAHVLTQMQLVMLAVFAFIFLQRIGAYPPEKRGVILDSDWAYRKAGYDSAVWLGRVWGKTGLAMTSVWRNLSSQAYQRIEAAFSPQGVLSRGPLTGGMAIWTAVLLGIVLLLSFIAVR